jgi:hypothetical protein
MNALLALTLCAAVGESPDPFSANGLTGADRKILSKREAVVKGELFKTPEGKNAGRGVAFVEIAKGLDECWQTLLELEKQPEYLPRLKRLTFLSRTPTSARAVHEVHIVWSTYVYTMNLVFHPESHSMTFSLDKTAKNDIKDTNGSWEFFPVDAQSTLLKYSIAVDSGLFVPAFIEDYLTRRDLPKILTFFRNRVESGGTWKKDE